MPFQLENGTDYIGLEIADQIWLENDATSIGIKWSRCCCHPQVNACSWFGTGSAPTNLYFNEPHFGNIILTLDNAPDDTGECHWTGCTQIGTSTTNGIDVPLGAYQCDGITAYYAVWCRMNDNSNWQLFFGWSRPGSAVCISGAKCIGPGDSSVCNFSNYLLNGYILGSSTDYIIGAAGSQSAPFFKQWTYSFADSGYDLLIGVPCSVFTMPSTTWTLAANQDAVPCCDIYFKVRGCNAIFLPGATITVWNNSSKIAQISTGVTDATGGVTLSTGAVASSGFYFEISKTRFVTYSETVTNRTYNQIYIRQIDPDTDNYHPVPGCAIPVSNTLSWTDVNGSFNLVYVTAYDQWWGCSFKSSMANVVVDVTPSTCESTLGTASIQYSVVFSAGEIIITWLKYHDPVAIAYYLIHSDHAANTPTCGDAGIEYIGFNPSGCFSNITSEQTINSNTITCSAFSVSGTLPNGVNTISPAAGSYTLTE